MTAPWRSTACVAFVFVARYVLALWWMRLQYKNRRYHFRAGIAFARFVSSQDAWASATVGMDSSAYLRAAQNFAAGRGITIRETRSATTEDTPFYYWGPGAPVVLGTWLKIVGGSTMWTFFWFAVTAQFIFGLVAIATAALLDSVNAGTVAVAFCTGICPPMLIAWHGPGMTCSEIVVLVPLSVVFYLLARGFMAYRAWQMGIGKLRWFACVGIWFLWRGGVDRALWAPLVRDSGAVLAAFAGIFLLGRAIVADRSKIRAATGAAAPLIVGCAAVRLPVEGLELLAHWPRGGLH